MADKLVIYHGGCRDGFASAFAFWTKHKNSTNFYPGYYGQAPPYYLMHKNIEVILLDFSYKKDVLEGLLEHCSNILILDHHKTAEADLAGVRDERIHIIFDMNRSGVGLTWDYLYPNRTQPWWVRYVQDRDLWTNKLPYTKEINAWISTWKFDFKAWEDYTCFGSTVEEDFLLRDAREKGTACLSKTLQYCREVSKNAIRVDICMHLHPEPAVQSVLEDVWIVNAPQCDISELLDYILDDKQTNIAMGWWQNQDGSFQYSLRSRGDVDVSETAKIFGGGGHKNAAGFQSKHITHVRVPDEY